MLYELKNNIGRTVSIYSNAKGIIQTLPLCQSKIWIIHAALSEEMSKLRTRKPSASITEDVRYLFNLIWC